MSKSSTHEIVITKKTHDGYFVLGWSDGTVTNAVGWIVSKTLPIDAMRMVLNEVCLYDYPEIRTLCETARKLHKKNKLSLVELRESVHVELKRKYTQQ